MKFLFQIKRRPLNISSLAKKSDMTLSVASILISRLARKNVVYKKKLEGGRGKEMIITLTPYGEEQVKLLRKISDNYEKNEKGLYDKEVTR